LACDDLSAYDLDGLYNLVLIATGDREQARRFKMRAYAKRLLTGST
jgi:hypothetical protein